MSSRWLFRLRNSPGQRHVQLTISSRSWLHQTCRLSNEQTYRAKRTSTLSPTLLLLGIMPIVTFGLGTWQIQRLKWKVNLIDELQEKLQRPPMTLPGRVDVSAVSDFVFRKVLVRGHWDYPHTVLVGPRVRDGTKGFNVITPLIRDSGSTILVDRGYISDEHADFDKLRSGNQATDDIEVLGMLRTAQKRNRFTPDNRPDKGEWYWVDMDALAQYAGGEEAGVQPIFVEEIFEGHPGDAHLRLTRGIPIGRAPTVDLRNAHATYALTWYSLSAATLVMFVHLMRKRAQSPSVRMPRTR